MRNFILLLPMLTLVLSLMAQGPETVVRNHDYYLNKSKGQKTVAWVMLGGGFAVATVGLILVNSQINNDAVGYYYGESGNAESVIALLGMGSMLGSIPFFVSSARNKRRAASLTFNNQKILFPLQNDFAMQYVPTLSFKIRF